MTGPVPVSDASRKAAWRFHDFPYMPDEQTRERWFSGYYDDNRVLQAFARHAERSRLAALDEAAEVLRECEQTFRFYEQNHLAKKTQDGDEKAHRNKTMADKCAAILKLKEAPDAK